MEAGHQVGTAVADERIIALVAAEDVLEAKKMIRGRAAVMAKIEKPQAIDRLPEIIEASDALMVARGDLGVERDVELPAGVPEAAVVIVEDVLAVVQVRDRVAGRRVGRRARGLYG